jgi:hypothetical protein
MTTAPTPDGGHDWYGDGNFERASRALRGYLPMSFGFRGVTKSRDPEHLYGHFATDEPTGVRWLPASSVGSQRAALIMVGCGAGPGTSRPYGVDGVYRMTVNAADLARLNAPSRGRHLDAHLGRTSVCGHVGAHCLVHMGIRRAARHGRRIDLRVIDAGGMPAAAPADPGNGYSARWSL